MGCDNAVFPDGMMEEALRLSHIFVIAFFPDLQRVTRVVQLVISINERPMRCLIDRFFLQYSTCLSYAFSCYMNCSGYAPEEYRKKYESGLAHIGNVRIA